MRRTLLLLALAADAGADDAAVSRAQAIGKAGPEAARERIPELIAIGKGGARERFAARDALAIAGPHAVAPLLEGASGDADLRLLLEGVSYDLGAAVVAPALPALASENAATRAMAAAALGAAGKGGEAAVKRLIEALYDDDAAVRREAATALGRIGRGAHDAIPGLILLANDRERGCTREAILALGMILRDAAERARPAPKVSPEVSSAIQKGLAWLARQQTPEGWWAIPAAGDVAAPEKARACVASLALLAMLDGGADPRAPELRAGLRFVVAADASPGDYPQSWCDVDVVATTLCAAARVLGEPECTAVAKRLVAADVATGAEPGAWRALAVLEADFAGLSHPPSGHTGDVVPWVQVLVRLAAGEDPTSKEVRGEVESCPKDLQRFPDGKLRWPEDPGLVARARWYGGVKSDTLVESVLKEQREDGSWKSEPLDPVPSTACMLLALEAAAGLAHPLTMPLPDAPQLKAAVATLQLAAQSKDPEIRAAAQQALAGFAAR
ncbi:MAG TPA: HEAT repeat domain-containing protein [Planctomycetota bacterium]|nr:HEAT repeat domain-containing protein [Planctomycetota bacterium]